MVILICTVTLVFTFLGGWFALSLKRKLHLILGFSAGALIGVAFFDLLPTAIEVSAKFYTPREIVLITGLGFITYLILDSVVIFLNTLARRKNYTGLRGSVAAFCLTLHSFLDGVTIGLAFKVSTKIGLLIALSVIVHDVADGINTTSLIMKEKGSSRTAFTWLTMNSVAPILGAVSTIFLSLTAEALGILLALVSGFFLFLGASDIFPESRLREPGLQTLLMTLLGIFVIFIALRITVAF